MNRTSFRLGLFPVSVVALLLSSCTTAPSAGEKQARQEVARVGDALAAKPSMAQLTPDSPLADYVRFAALNHPEVRAAYLDWRAAVSAIAPNRALPDPQLTFEADIADTIMTLMPGVMFDFMAPAKRRAMADEALGSANTAYRAYVGSVLNVAARVRKGAIELAYVDQALALRDEAIAALDQATDVARAEYSTTAGMATLETQVRLTNEVAKVRSEVAALGDRRTSARARFKASLGLTPADPDPAWPKLTLTATALPPDDELWQRARASNPNLARMRAMVDMALSGVDVAHSAGIPDFTVGAMADVKAEPLMVRPTATVTLPIWREKIRSNIAAAKARHEAAAARVSAEEISMAAEIAQMLYMVRESDRMIEYVDRTALPNYERSVASIAASYQAGMGGAGMIPEIRAMEVVMKLERLAALRDRENAVTDLLLMTADVAPAGTSLLAGAEANAR